MQNADRTYLSIWTTPDIDEVISI